MAKLDADIWERFIAAHPDYFDRCAYNVAVGEGTPHDTMVNGETGGDINRLYQRKIDVVGDKGGNYVVVEVKPRASTAAIGQVKGYAKLFARDAEISAPIKKLILTNELLPEMAELAADDGVDILVV
jgi:hypothetical protein